MAELGDPQNNHLKVQVAGTNGKGSVCSLVDAIRRGTDVLKALSLGAKFVWVGRPFNYAAAISGVDGVRHAFTILQGEVLRNMQLLGVNRVDELGLDRLVRMSGVRAPGAAL